MALKKKTLKRKVEENTTISTNTSGQVETVKEGKPLEHTKKHNVTNHTKTVGINIGATVNMGDYQSLRVDCWLTDEVGEDETHEEALIRIGQIAKDHLDYEIDRIMEEE